MKAPLRFTSVFAVLFQAAIWAAVFGNVRGVVHDPDHRPVQGAEVMVKSSRSDYIQKLTTDAVGVLEATALPGGAYVVTVRKDGFATSVQEIVIASGSAPVLHFQLMIGARSEQVTVSEGALTVNPEQWRPPRSSAIDGVPIPNTNIASNIGPQIDPKDIDYLEAQRGGYSSGYGDRSYGVVNVVPRTGFERSNEGELFTTFGTLHQTNDRVNFGTHTETFAWFASVNGNRSDYGWKPRVRMSCTIACGGWEANAI